MVIGIASDHNIEENNILVSNFIEYMACDPRFPASSIGSHQSDSDRWVRVKLWVDDDLGMEFFQRFDIWLIPLPASVSFVELADVSEEEWTLFLEKFQDLLYPAFAKRKSVTVGQRQRQRLGTSCQF
ncbi:hypothetical protein Q3G72_035360 [Acer saccharum]|nr:hypothetical protein Q3G72_035360 [Acer saccharum]